MKSVSLRGLAGVAAFASSTAFAAVALPQLAIDTTQISVSGLSSGGFMANQLGVALALLPVAEEYKKILLVEPAVADAITGDKWNKYIFAPAATAARTPSAMPWPSTRPG